MSALAAGFTLREEEGGALLFNQRTARVQTLNETGAAIFMNLLNGRQPDYGICEAYPQVDSTRIHNDAFQFAGQVERLGAITAETSGGPSGRVIRRDWEPNGQCLSAPRSVFLEVTGLCTIRDCVHCYSAGRDGDPGIDWFKIVDQLCVLGVFTLDIGGGEPLLRADLAGLINRANHGGMRCNIATSLFVSVKRLCELLNGVDDWDLNSLQISLDGPDAGLHDYIRGRPGVFEKLKSNLLLVRENGLPYSFSCTVMQPNVDHLEEIVQAAHDLGGKRVRFVRLIPSGRGNDGDLLLGADQYRAMCAELRRLSGVWADRIAVTTDSSFDFLDLSSEKQHLLKPRIPWLKAPSMGCAAGRSLVAIDASGKISPCAYLGSEFAVGTILEDDLGSLWKSGTRLLAWRQKTSTCRDCLGCDLALVCQGGCRAAAYGAARSLEAIDPGCWSRHAATH